MADIEKLLRRTNITRIKRTSYEYLRLDAK